MTPVAIPRRGPVGLALPVLLAASVCHFLNDATQSLFTASYPIFRSGFGLNFAEIGLLTLAYQLSASILQPIIGLNTDRHPAPYSLPVGMGISAAPALITLAFAPAIPSSSPGRRCSGSDRRSSTPNCRASPASPPAARTACAVDFPGRR